MVCHRGRWYRARVLTDGGGPRVLLEFAGVRELTGAPVWLARTSRRLWTGSYKGRDWKYLGDGAWEPKGWAVPAGSGLGASLMSEATRGVAPPGSGNAGGGGRRERH